MLNFVIARDVLAKTDLPEHEQVPCAMAGQTFDSHALPDGLPFFIEDDGTFAGCWSLNQYCIDAVDRKGLSAKNLRDDRMPVMARFTRWLRRREARRLADLAGLSLTDWLASNLEPQLDLVFATRQELVAYTEERAREVALSTQQTQSGYLSAFYFHATREGWIARSPVPTWSGRNTLVPRGRNQRRARFLSATQTEHLLSVGLRGDGSSPTTAPANPERDYVFGLLLATTGLRRREGAFLLNHEVPVPADFGPDGIFTFPRTGKRGVTRTIYVTKEVAKKVELYRRVEREIVVRAAQPRLRRLLRDGDLLKLDELTENKGQPAYRLNGKVLLSTVLSNEDRLRAVTVTDEGEIEPAALLVSRLGLPLHLRYWNQLFVDARDRVHTGGHTARPPEHVPVTPHTLRHTFAVRMLAVLMDASTRKHGDPYRLLANPVLTVKELMGHASVETTHEYLYAATTWHVNVPAALTQTVVELLGPQDGLE